MDGTVVLVNQRKGFFAVEVGAGSGDFTVVELLDSCEVAVGDIVSGDLHSHGGEELMNKTQRQSMSVYIQGIHCAASTARAMVLR